MGKLKFLSAALSLGLLALASPAPAQQLISATVVTTCGSGVSYTAGTPQPPTVDLTGKLCTNAASGGGGAVTIIDGGDVALGSKADTASIAPGGTLLAAIRQLDVDVKGTDPCTSAAVKTPITVTSSAAAEPQIVAPSGVTQVYICSLFIMGGTPAVHVSVVGGTGATCTTGTPAAMVGSTTASAGAAFPVSGGFSFGSGVGTVLRTITAGHGVCILQDGTTPLAFGGTYVQQ